MMMPHSIKDVSWDGWVAFQKFVSGRRMGLDQQTFLAIELPRLVKDRERDTSLADVHETSRPSTIARCRACPCPGSIRSRRLFPSPKGSADKFPHDAGGRFQASCTSRPLQCCPRLCRPLYLLRQRRSARRSGRQKTSKLSRSRRRLPRGGCLEELRRQRPVEGFCRRALPAACPD